VPAPVQLPPTFETPIGNLTPWDYFELPADQPRENSDLFSMPADSVQQNSFELDDDFGFGLKTHPFDDYGFSNDYNS
jgi:hypothetical protein